MKKSTIWMLTVVMAFAFIGLLILQVQYIATIFKTSNEQFESTVRRCLEKVSREFEQEEARAYLEEYTNSTGTDFMYKNPPNQQNINQMMQSIRMQIIKEDSIGTIKSIERIESYRVTQKIQKPLL